jgi:succinate dehydrogenase / fumarate reductase iron-sulfur subunit
LLDVLTKLKAKDDSLSYRRSCREGICGSDAMNINGKNGLACLTEISELKQPVVLRPLPGLPVIRDLIVDMTQFFKQYHSIKPYLINDTPPPERERLQSPEEREELNGLYECILCACCSTSCPSFWWNPDKFVGPAGLLNAYRFIADTRDEATNERLDDLEDPYRLFRCHTHHELCRCLSEGSESDQGDRQDQGNDGSESDLMDAEKTSTACAGAVRAARCWRWTSAGGVFSRRIYSRHLTRAGSCIRHLADMEDLELWPLITGSRECADAVQAEVVACCAT